MFLTIQEAARRLGVTRWTMKRLIRENAVDYTSEGLSARSLREVDEESPWLFS